MYVIGLPNNMMFLKCWIEIDFVILTGDGYRSQLKLILTIVIGSNQCVII